MIDWLKLTLEILDGFQYFVNPNQEKHVVGRQEDVSLPLAGDQTISRVHAILYINDEHRLEVSDEGSKYKVFLNHNIETKRPMIQNVKQPLKEGDRILFGRANHIFTVHKFNVSVVASTLLPAEKKELDTLILRLGGKISDKITPNTSHLVMQSITITSKLTYALAHCIPIVKIDYWRKVCNAATNNETFPDPKDYMPLLNESYLRDQNLSFAVDLRRKTLFRGKTFLFFSQRQYDVYHEIIQGAGGKCQQLKAAGLKKTSLVAPNTVVILLDSPEHAFPGFTQPLIEELDAYVRTKGLRFVPSTEINLAIIHATIEKYCNPKYKFEINVATQSDTEMRSATVIAGESAPLDTQLQGNADLLLLPETNEASQSEALTPKKNNQFNSQKRKLEILEARYAKRRKVQEEYEKLPRCPPNTSGNWLNKNTQEPVIVPEGGTAEIQPFDVARLFEDEDDVSFVVNRKRPAEGDNGDDANGTEENGADDDDGFFVRRKKPKPSEEPEQNGTIPTISLVDNGSAKNGAPVEIVDISKYHQPIKVSATGWLSASFGKLQVKDEKLEPKVDESEEVKKETEPYVDEYVKQAEDGFAIEVKPIVVESKSFINNITGDQSTIHGGKNFKTFQKKRNYRPQTQSLPTVTVQLGFSQQAIY